MSKAYRRFKLKLGPSAAPKFRDGNRMRRKEAERDKNLLLSKIVHNLAAGKKP